MRFLGLCAVVALLCLIDVAGTTFRQDPDDEDLDIRDAAECRRHYPHPRHGHHHPQVHHHHPVHPLGHYHHHHPHGPFGHHPHVHPGPRPRPHHLHQLPRHVQLQDDAPAEFFEVDAEDLP